MKRRRGFPTSYDAHSCKSGQARHDPHQLLAGRRAGDHRTGADTAARTALAQGKIVALKGIGAFQLLADARSSAAVLRLRQREHRENKPFAMLMPSLDCIRRYCEVGTEEEVLLSSSAAPIVLLSQHNAGDLAPEVAQHSSCAGVMLPYTPLHHLLMAHHPFPLVATSGNIAGEPMAIDNDEALDSLERHGRHLRAAQPAHRSRLRRFRSEARRRPADSPPGTRICSASSDGAR